ncbi:MAG: nuclear transport factor 2 family protein [Pseudomonadota bacterium]
MQPLETARAFFDACESAKGWAGCAQYVADSATFSAQSEPLTDISTVEAYCEWMAGFVNGVAPDGDYTVHAQAYDDGTSTAVFFATFSGTHTADGGPVPPTGKKTQSHYVYAITLDEDGKVSHMTKVWNSGWALAELGWA